VAKAAAVAAGGSCAAALHPGCLAENARAEACVKHVIVPEMVTISIRELRQAWPRAEALLRTTGEVIITRDGRPVARLVQVREPRRPRKRFDARRHRAWQSRVGRGRTVRWVDEFLFKERDAN
jgi:antitoxin (DNA-binding transcriptional repressor) of toxin-antitoxin stability system